MRALRKRSRPDTLRNEPRRERAKFARYVYLALTFLLAGTVLDYAFGDRLFLRADGLVLYPKVEISAPYVAQAASVMVSKGQNVKKDDPLMKLASLDMLERLADLSNHRADLAAQRAELRVRLNIAKDLLPIAARRAKEAHALVADLDNLADRSIITASQYQRALDAAYAAKRDTARLKIERSSLSAELVSFESALRDADRAISDLKESYAEGVVRAPRDGTVHEDIPSPGEVFMPGERMLTILYGEPHVLTYLPREYLFETSPGQQVVVTNGKDQVAGEIVDVLPIAGILPKEFQNSFERRGRSQMAIINFLQPSPFPALETVEIQSSWRNHMIGALSLLGP